MTPHRKDSILLLAAGRAAPGSASPHRQHQAQEGQRHGIQERLRGRQQRAAGRAPAAPREVPLHGAARRSRVRRLACGLRHTGARTPGNRVNSRVGPPGGTAGAARPNENIWCADRPALQAVPLAGSCVYACATQQCSLPARCGPGSSSGRSGRGRRSRLGGWGGRACMPSCRSAAAVPCTRCRHSAVSPTAPRPAVAKSPASPSELTCAHRQRTSGRAWHTNHSAPVHCARAPPANHPSPWCSV